MLVMLQGTPSDTLASSISSVTRRRKKVVIIILTAVSLNVASNRSRVILRNGCVWKDCLMEHKVRPSIASKMVKKLP
jgi:hypothetical protein